MAAIQPKNTTAIKVDTVTEKTGAAGVTINSVVKAVSATSLQPVSATINLGDSSTAALHFLEIFAKELTSNGQDISVGTQSAHSTNLKTTDLIRWAVDSSGNLNQDATNGGNLSVIKASTSLLQALAVGVSAAGANLAAATQLTSVLTRVTTVSASQGVKMWAAGVGTMAIVWNSSGTTLNIYPDNGSTGTINGGGVGTAVTAATNVVTILFRDSTTNWAAFKFTVTTS